MNGLFLPPPTLTNAFSIYFSSPFYIFITICIACHKTFPFSDPNSHFENEFNGLLLKRFTRHHTSDSLLFTKSIHSIHAYHQLNSSSISPGVAQRMVNKFLCKIVLIALALSMLPINILHHFTIKMVANVIQF